MKRLRREDIAHFRSIYKLRRLVVIQKCLPGMNNQGLIDFLEKSKVFLVPVEVNRGFKRDLIKLP